MCTSCWLCAETSAGNVQHSLLPFERLKEVLKNFKRKGPDQFHVKQCLYSCWDITRQHSLTRRQLHQVHCPEDIACCLLSSCRGGRRPNSASSYWSESAQLMYSSSHWPNCSLPMHAHTLVRMPRLPPLSSTGVDKLSHCVPRVSIAYWSFDEWGGLSCGCSVWHVFPTLSRFHAHTLLYQ